MASGSLMNTATTAHNAAPTTTSGSPTADKPAVALLFGQVISDLPPDLFIPPDALQVILTHFEGPLDLLLYLIRKQNLDILDIPMRTVTEQYLGYIAQIDQQNFDLAAEYLLMAAVLIEIKSRLLLPQNPDNPNEDETDPRAELVRRLLVYEQMKLAAQHLDILPRAGRDFAWAYLPLDLAHTVRLPEVQIADLTQAWLGILQRAQHHQHHTVHTETLSVRAQMGDILRRLNHHGTLTFTQLFQATDSRAVLVVNFIALLELVKEGSIHINQTDHQFGTIHIYPTSHPQAT